MRAVISYGPKRVPGEIGTERPDYIVRVSTSPSRGTRSSCRPGVSRTPFQHSGGRNRPGAFSDRKAGIALDDLLPQHGPLARFPERCRMNDPVAKRTAIGTIAARDRAWNADELGAHFIDGEPHRRIAVTAHIHECKVRGKFRIGNGVRALQVETLRVFEARADPVLEEHVVGPVHSGGPCPPDRGGPIGPVD